ncbi:MAG: neutral zinc metallopeptidase [Nakamurella sp.]
MKFNRSARLDTSQVRDRRGSPGGRAGGFPGGRAGAAGGGLGLVGVIAVIVFAVLSGGSDGGGLAGGLLDQLGGDDGGSQVADNTELDESCRTGTDAGARDDCAVVAIVNSVQSYWSHAFDGSGEPYSNSPTVFYSGSTATGCGRGSAAMGPFYCPSDTTVYIDLSFWKELETQFGADASTFTQAYVIAHEYGHHVQDLLGATDSVTTRPGPASGSVRLELQADCYSGVWANHASTVPGADGQVLISDITDADIDNAVDTAGKIGDDWIQAHLGGSNPDPSKYTHGTTAQRQKWFKAGYSTGDPNRCDTFAASNLG